MTSHLQEHPQSVQRHLSEFQHEVQSQKVASREEVETSRHELSRSFLKEHIIRLCTQQADLVRPIVHQKCSSRDMGVIH